MGARTTFTWTKKHILIVVMSLLLVVGFTATLALYQLAHAAPTARHGFTITPLTTTSHTTAQGFDICQAPSLETMRTWWASSPYRWVNMYIGGLNRACPHGPTAEWVAAVYAMGWGLVPTYVGYQAPVGCLPTGVRGAGMNTDPFIAQLQGREAAIDAMASAQAIGLDAGTIIYYDLEYYYQPGQMAICNKAVAAYANGWDAGLHSAGYKAGLYIASTNVGAVEGATIDEPDAVWLVNSGFTAPSGGYAANCSVYGNGHLGDSAWHGHRLYQYLVNGGQHLDHRETWGGASLVIDSDCADGDIVGHDAPPKLAPSFSYVGQYADGRLVSFARGDDNAIWFAEQNKPDGLWSVWAHLGTIPATLTFMGSPQVAQLADGRLVVFARGTDKALWSVTQAAPNKPFGAWQPITGPSTVGPPTVARNADGSLLLLALGTDGNIWDTTQAANVATWAPWQPLQTGQHFTAAPAVAQDADGRIEVFAIGKDGNVWVNFQRSVNRDWFGWLALQPIAPTLATTPPQVIKFVGVPTTVRDHEGRLTVFARGTDGSLWQNAQKTQGGTWSGWSLIPTTVPIVGDPAVAVNLNGLLSVLALGNDGNLWDSQQTATGWLAWATLEDGVTFTGTPAIGTSADGRLIAFALGSDGNLWAAQQQNAGGVWSTWAHLEDGYTFQQ